MLVFTSSDPAVGRRQELAASALAERPDKSGDEPKSKPVTFTLEPIARQQDQSERLIPELLGLLLGVGSKAGSVKDVEDSTVGSAWYPLQAPGDTSRSMWCAWAKFPLRSNTINRVGVIQDRAADASLGRRSAWLTFGNYSPGYFGGSIGTTFAFVSDGDSAGPRPAIDAALMFHWNAFRPARIPSLKNGRVLFGSLGLVGAAKIGKDPLKTLFFGASLGHLFETDLGIDGGVSLRQGNGSSGSIWKGRPALALHYSL